MTNGDNEEDRGKDKKGEEKLVRILVFGVIVLGSVLIGSSTLFKNPELHYIIRGLGISIIGGAFIAWAIGHLISKGKFQKLFEDMKELYEKISETDKNINETVKKTSEKIIEDTTRISKKIIETDKNINENIRSRFELIKECEDNGLLKIYEPFDMRLKKDVPSEFEKDVNDFLLKEKNEIKIYGISLRLFCDNLRKFWPSMSNAFDRMDDNNLKIKILLLSPYSDWTTQREEAEKGFCNKIRQDLSISINWLSDQLKKYDKQNEMYDNIRFYDAAPDSFLFITSECVIFEIYHSGISQLKREINETDKFVEALGLGGHVPAFKFNNSSPMYKYLDAHFDYYFAKEIEGNPNKYHDGTLPDIRKRKKKEPF